MIPVVESSLFQFGDGKSRMFGAYEDKYPILTNHSILSKLRTNLNGNVSNILLGKSISTEEDIIDFLLEDNKSHIDSGIEECKSFRSYDDSKMFCATYMKYYIDIAPNKNLLPTVVPKGHSKGIIIPGGRHCGILFYDILFAVSQFYYDKDDGEKISRSEVEKGIKSIIKDIRGDEIDLFVNGNPIIVLISFTGGFKSKYFKVNTSTNGIITELEGFTPYMSGRTNKNIIHNNAYQAKNNATQIGPTVKNTVTNLSKPNFDMLSNFESGALKT